jgi:peptidyl-prolyl cis-trans isomerase C
MNISIGHKATSGYAPAAAIAAIALFSANPVHSEAVSTVNGTAIDSTVLDVYIENRVEKPLEQVTAEERQALLSELIDIYLLSTQESASELEQDPRVAAQIELQRRGVLAQAAASEFFEGLDVSDEEIQAEYSEQVQQTPRIQYKARHILVPTQGVAQDVIQRLDDGAGFEELATEKSTGPSGPNGGDLGWFAPNQMVKPFADAVALLENGEYTKAPVQTEFGWHVILREDSREPEPPTLESVRGSLVQSVQQRKFQQHLEQLRTEAAGEE